MSNLFIYFKDPASAAKLKELGVSKGFDVHATSDLKAARHSLSQQHFDVAFVDAQIDLPIQQELAGLLWDRNEFAPLMVYDFNPLARGGVSDARLFGAEVARGENALVNLRNCLERLNPKGARGGMDFPVLVVDDLESPRDILCTYVESLGYPKVTGAASGEQALAELKADPNKFACIVTDIQMPNIDGKQLIKRIRQDPKLQHLPIIVLTAFGTGDCLIDCLKAGASGFLVKPPRKNDLVRELRRAQRISTHRSDPRLARPDEVLQMREALEDKGLL